MKSLNSLDKFNQVIPVIVGPTGSGKTGVSIEIAGEIKKSFGREVEIISADSRTIYKGMDIGTAKPTVEERRGVKHFGFDLVEPGERFTVKDWKDYAEEKIAEIRGRGNIPMIVGGTGLYVDALVFNYSFSQEAKERYLDRAEQNEAYKIFGILWNAEELRDRLFERANKLFEQPLYDETKRLVEKYGWDNQAMTSDIYQFAWRYIEGEISREEAIRLNAIDDWHLAKRQMTWFRRNKNIVWLPLEKIKPYVLKCMQDEQRK